MTNLKFSLLPVLLLLGCSDPAVATGDTDSDTDSDAPSSSSSGSTSEGTSTGGEESSTVTGTTEDTITPGSESSSGDVVTEPGEALWAYEPSDEILDLVAAEDDSVYLLLDTEDLTIEHISADGALVDVIELAPTPAEPRGSTGYTFDGRLVTLLDGVPLSVSEYWYNIEDEFFVFGRSELTGADGWISEVPDRRVEELRVSGGGLLGAEYVGDVHSVFRLDALGEDVFRVEPESSVRNVADRTGGGMFAMGSSWVYAYDAQGALSWTVEFEHETVSTLDRNRAFAAMPDGGVVVLRDAIDDPAKLTSSGRLIFISEDGEEISRQTLPPVGFDLEVDSTGALYIHQALERAERGVGYLVKYDADMQQQWSFEIDGLDLPRVVLSPQDAVFVATDVLLRLAP